MSRIPLQRSEAVAVARSWIGTPYELKGRIKGAGCDCATFLAEYLIEIGAVTRGDLEDLGFYSHDWFCHATSERYLRGVLRHAQKAAEGICRGTVDAAPGSLILFRVVASKYFNHGGVIVNWPQIIHAADDRVHESDATSHFLTGFREFAIFDPWSPSAPDPVD